MVSDRSTAAPTIAVVVVIGVVACSFIPAAVASLIVVGRVVPRHLVLAAMARELVVDSVVQAGSQAPGRGIPAFQMIHSEDEGASGAVSHGSISHRFAGMANERGEQ